MKKAVADAYKGDSGSSDDVLTINLSNKDGKKKKAKKAKRPLPAEEPANKRKKVSFHIEKNMTRGKSSIFCV